MKRRSFLQSLIALTAVPAVPVIAETIQPKVPIVDSVVRHGVGDYTINYKWVEFDGVKYTGNGSYK